MKTHQLFLTILSIIFALSLLPHAESAETYSVKTGRINLSKSTDMVKFSAAIGKFVEACKIPLTPILQNASRSNIYTFQVYMLVPADLVDSSACSSQAFANTVKSFASIIQPLTTSSKPYSITSCTTPNEEGVPTTMKCIANDLDRCQAVLCPVDSACATAVECELGSCVNNICYNTAAVVFKGISVAAIVLLSLFFVL
jgi:hypothetical protein